MDSARGQLLIAGPGLLDPNFWRAVVLIVEHTDDGALGLVLNRPSETTRRARPYRSSSTLVDPDDQLYIGGPVQPSAVIVLAEFEDPSDAALIAFGDIGVLGNGSPRSRRSACEPAGRSSAMPAGAPASSTPSSSAATGFSSRRGARMPSPRSRASCGPRC